MKSAFSWGPKICRLASTGLLLGVLVVAAVPASADEQVNYLQTALTGTTISGYVNTSVRWDTSPTQATQVRGFRYWWNRFLTRIGYYGND